MVWSEFEWIYSFSGIYIYAVFLRGYSYVITHFEICIVFMFMQKYGYSYVITHFEICIVFIFMQKLCL